MTPILLILAVLLGFAPGLIAHGKGRNFFVWWAYGVVLGPIALLHAMLLRGTRRPQFTAAAPQHRSTPWETPWPLLLLAASSFAVAIIGIAAYHLLVPGKHAFLATKQESVASADRDAAKALASAPQLASVERDPPATVTPPREPAPEVKVMIRRDDISSADSTPPKQVATDTSLATPAPATPAADPAPKAAAAAPQPPAAPKTLERTMATSADSVPTAKPAPPKPAPVQDVRIARVTPVQPATTAEPSTPAMAKPKPAAQPHDTASPPKPPKQHAERKPAAAKPTATDVNAVGEIVRAVQRALSARGYDPGAANGRAGRQTQVAIRKFQADRGLARTGEIDYALLENLKIVGPRLHAFRPPPGATAGR